MAGGDYVCGLGYILSCPSSMFPSLEVPGREEKSEVSGVEASGLRSFQTVLFTLQSEEQVRLASYRPVPSAPSLRGCPKPSESRSRSWLFRILAGIPFHRRK